MGPTSMAASPQPFSPKQALLLPCLQWPLLAIDAQSQTIVWHSPALSATELSGALDDIILLESPLSVSPSYDAPSEWLLGRKADDDEPVMCRIWVDADSANHWWVLVVPLPEMQSSAEVAALHQRHRDFVSVVSHEFRTPLTSIKGFADTLLRYGASLKPEQQAKFITTIKEQADRLTRMVENLLTVSKLGEGTVQVECRTLPLGPMLERVIENIKAKASQDPLYANRTLSLNLPDTLPASWVDPDKIEQVLTNIIDNAVKYAFANTQVDVSVTHHKDDEMLLVAVTNRGEGIPKDQLPKIFKRFSRADNPLTRQVEGTGLGLYITRNLITAMGGTITVDSTPGETTTFTIHIPEATAQRQSDWHKQREADDDDDDIAGSGAGTLEAR